jgi:hypothetical protein
VSDGFGVIGGTLIKVHTPINATDAAPVVTTPNGTSFTVSYNAPVAASTFFTASDADTDSIDQYDFWDNGSAGGTHPELRRNHVEPLRGFLADQMHRRAAAGVGHVLSRILVVPVCYGPSMAVGSSNYIEIGQSSNWLRTDRGTSLNVGASTLGRSRCHGSSEAVARGTCNRCDQKTRRPGLAADCRLRPKP